MTPAAAPAVALLATTLLVGAIPGPTAPTDATQAVPAGCVTRVEYRDARHDMTKRSVHRIFGTRGTRIYLIIDNEERRAYRTCDPTLRLSVVYLRGRLGYKELRDATRP